MPRSRPKSHACAACGADADRAPAVRAVRVEGCLVRLCARHASALGAATPASWEALRAALRPRGEKRSSLPRRKPGDERRVFPPRPEGRRLGEGRRARDAR